MGVSLFQVARVYPVCFVPSYLAGGMWGLLLAGVLFDQLHGGNAKGLGIAIGMVVLVSLAALMVCRLRANRVEEILATGERVTATLERQLSYQQWATLWVRYERQGETTARKLSLVSSKRIEALEGRETVTLVFSPSHPCSPVVLELFD